MTKRTENAPVAVGVKLPCGHMSERYPVSSTNKAHYYRCSQGCGLQKVKRHPT